MFSYLVVALTEGLTIAIIARAILSWVPGSRALAPLTAALDSVTRPILDPIRRGLPAFAGIDLSPLVAIVLLAVTRTLLLGVLAGQ